VEARDASTGLPVPNGIVRIRNFDRYGNVVTSDHPVNTPFRFTFNVRKGVDPITHASQVIEVPSGKVIVPGYSEVDVDFGFR
jgi:hypothetical protein